MGLVKRIMSPSDLRQWTVSAAYNEILLLIQNVNQSVISQSIVKNPAVSKSVKAVCELLESLQKKIAEFPLEEQPQRFGNKAFRNWFSWLQQSAQELCRSIIFDEHSNEDFTNPPISFTEALAEVSGYLIESVGNATRIDYGTGHELAFLAFLTCLFKLGVLQTKKEPGSSLLKDAAATGLVIMPCYLNLVRQLQTFYHMEPAGSHGVWCLDDFQFVPFIWGSSQLMGSSYDPINIPDSHIAEIEKDNNLLFSCIAYIYECKSGPFEEHSQTIYSISQVPNWEKVNSGLIKMYKAEVLNKFPVVQHFLFGHLLSFDRAGAPKSSASSNLFSLSKPISAQSEVPKNKIHLVQSGGMGEQKSSIN